MAKISLQTPTARARLAPRGKSHKIRLLPGVHLGYRAAQSGTGAWIVIAANGRGNYWSKAFAHADDKLPADGSAILSYEQAANKARALARGDANAASDAPVSIGRALDSYEADLLVVTATHTTRNGLAITCPHILRPSRFHRSPVSNCAGGAAD